MREKIVAGRLVSHGEYLDRLANSRNRVASHSAASRSGRGVQCQLLSHVGGQIAGGGSRAAEVSSIQRQPPVGCGAVGIPVQPLAHMPSAGPGPGARSDWQPAVSKARRVSDNFVNRVVERCGPAVVRVETEQKISEPAFADADVFSFFFGVRPDAGPREGPKERKVHGSGSGFCIDGASGIILTNAHVVQNADRVSVTFAGKGPAIECQVLETDEVIDVAVLRVKERPRAPLPSMVLGSSESVRTGDWAIILGSPLGLQNTCTLGIVSSLDRSTGETGFDWMRHPLLQTDAAVNQGNSGGPMLNELGEVIGIVSMRAMFGEGIGFAVPTDSVGSALPSLLKGSKVPRAYLGLKMSSGAASGGGRGADGANVEIVLPGSPAEAAGFQSGDRIVELDGKRVRSFDEVQSAVRSSRVGARLSFKVQREGHKSQTLAVVAADIKMLKENSAGPGKGAGRGRRGQGPHQRIIIMPGGPKA